MGDEAAGGRPRTPIRLAHTLVALKFTLEMAREELIPQVSEGDLPAHPLQGAAAAATSGCVRFALATADWSAAPMACVP